MSLSIVDFNYDNLSYRSIDSGGPSNGETSGASLNRLLLPLMAAVILLMEKLMTDKFGSGTPSGQGSDGSEPSPGRDAAGGSDHSDPQSYVKDLLQALSKMLENHEQNSSNDPACDPGKGPGSYGHDKQDHRGTSGSDRHVDSKNAPSNKSNPKDQAKSQGTDCPAKPSELPPAKGEKIVNEPIVVKAGEVFDGKGAHFKAGPALGDGGQSERQKPVFILEPGAQLKNVQVSGADGVHAMGDAKLTNVWWRDVGEDAFTMKGPGNVEIEGGGAFNAADKIFQLNHGGSFSLNNFTADTFGKAIRTNGGKDFPIDISVTNSSFTNGEEAVVRTDAKQASIYLANNTIENTKWDVMAPDEANVVGATRRGWKDFSG